MMFGSESEKSLSRPLAAGVMQGDAKVTQDDFAAGMKSSVSKTQMELGPSFLPW